MSTGTLRRARLTVIVLVAAVGLLLSGLTGAPSQAAVDSKLTITKVRPAYAIPDTIGDYPFVTTGDAFSVDVVSDIPLSTNRPVPLILTAATGPEAGKVLARTTLPAAQTSATFTGAVLTKEALAVQLKAAVERKNSGTVPGIAVIDVLQEAVSAGPATELLSILGGGGIDKPCAVTETDPYCLEMHGGGISEQLLAAGQCDPSMGCSKSPTFTWLGNVATVSKLIFRGHKSQFPGTGVPHFALAAQLLRDGPIFDVADCPTRDTVGADRLPCQAFGTRYGSGNLYLEINWIDDGRVTIK